MDEASYWKLFQSMEIEVNRAIALFFMADEINNLARDNPLLLKHLNEAPEFWLTQRYAFDIAFHIELNKIFDTGKDVRSIHGLLQATVNNSNFFSKDALGVRKSLGATKPDWLDKYLDEVVEPTQVDLTSLRNALSPFANKMNQVYAPIRNKIVAHNILKETSESDALFAKTNLDDIMELLYFLHDIMQNLWHLFHNGEIPKLGSSDRNFHERNRQEVKRALQRLC